MRYAHNLALLVLLILSGCATQTNFLPAAPILSPSPFPPPADPASFAPNIGSNPTPFPPPTDTAIPTVVLINPLTGLAPANPALLNRRPMAIKVANYPRYMRPQSGLTLADQVFEYYIEDGLTRFIAVFYSNDSEWVGPVRSGRYFDEHIQRMYQSFLVFKFADPRELDYFKASDFAKFLVVPTNGSCPPFRLLPEREKTVEVYNNSYFNTLLWPECIQKNELDNSRPFFHPGTFSTTPPPLEQLGITINTTYSVDSYHSWQYSPTDQQYYRFQENQDIRDGRAPSYEAAIDRVTGQQVHASNVIVLFVNHTFANTFDKDDEVFQIDLAGSGEAYVFRDGVGIVARWNRTNANQPLVMTTMSGVVIPLRPGITFYEVIGVRSFVDQTDGEWNFLHDWP